MKRAMWMLGALSALITGCPGTGNTGGGAGGGQSNDNMTPNEQLTDLELDFADDVPHGQDPANVTLGSGTVEFSGGVAGTLGIPPLYTESDGFAWLPEGGGTSTITFADLDVRRVQLYFAHTGDAGATMTAEEADGTAVGTIDSFKAASRGDANAVFEIDGQGTSIARLVFEVPEGAVASVDHLVLSIADAS